MTRASWKSEKVGTWRAINHDFDLPFRSQPSMRNPTWINLVISLRWTEKMIVERPNTDTRGRILASGYRRHKTPAIKSLAGNSSPFVLFDATHSLLSSDWRELLGYKRPGALHSAWYRHCTKSAGRRAGRRRRRRKRKRRRLFRLFCERMKRPRHLQRKRPDRFSALLRDSVYSPIIFLSPSPSPCTSTEALFCSLASPKAPTCSLTD